MTTQSDAARARALAEARGISIVEAAHQLGLLLNRSPDDLVQADAHATARGISIDQALAELGLIDWMAAGAARGAAPRPPRDMSIVKTETIVEGLARALGCSLDDARAHLGTFAGGPKQPPPIEPIVQRAKRPGIASVAAQETARDDRLTLAALHRLTPQEVAAIDPRVRDRLIRSVNWVLAIRAGRVDELDGAPPEPEDLEDAAKWIESIGELGRRFTEEKLAAPAEPDDDAPEGDAKPRPTKPKKQALPGLRRRMKIARAVARTKIASGEWTDDNARRPGQFYDSLRAADYATARALERGPDRVVENLVRLTPAWARAVRTVGLLLDEDGKPLARPRTWNDLYPRHVLAIALLILRHAEATDRCGWVALFTGFSRQMMANLLELPRSQQRTGDREPKNGVHPDLKYAMKIVNAFARLRLIYKEQPPADVVENPALKRKRKVRLATPDGGDRYVEREHSFNHYWIYPLAGLTDDELAELDADFDGDRELEAAWSDDTAAHGAQAPPAA